MLIGIEENGNLRLLLANKAFHDMTGLDPSCVGKELPEFIDTERLKLTTKYYKKVVKLKKPISYSTWTEMPAGKRAYEVDIIPVLSTVDEVVQLIVLARDITKVAKLKERVRVLRASMHKPRRP